VLYVQPAQHFRAFCRRASRHWRAGTLLVICAKGIEIGTGRLLSEIAAEELTSAPTAILSGPSFAREAACAKPTAIVIASPDPDLNAGLMQALSHGAFRPYGSTDAIGVEIAGAAKNVIAIACGIVMGRNLGENARAALMTRGLAETARLAIAKGGRAETMMGLAGIGDMALTCNSMTSRNMALGFALGEEGRSVISWPPRDKWPKACPRPRPSPLSRALEVEMPIARPWLRSRRLGRDRACDPGAAEASGTKAGATAPGEPGFAS
jgi:glycerol-3-phosphate dehydrogenase (NAD(P)+)